MMAKSEGGLGMDEGMVNLDRLAQLIHFILNENKSVPSKAHSDVLNGMSAGLLTDEFMNWLVKRMRQKQDEIKLWKEKKKSEADPIENNDQMQPPKPTSGRINEQLKGGVAEIGQPETPTD